MIELRPYQEEAIKLVLKAFQQNPHGQELIVLPTGAGKTIIAAEIIRSLHTNTLFIAHRDELLLQAAEKYRLVKPDAIVGKVGSGVHQYGGEVTVASIATISRPEHIKHLKAIGYGLIIIDEAHHAAGASYQRVLEALPDAFVLGITATPDRLDKKALFAGKKPLYQATIQDMVREGYLCDFKAIAIQTEIDLSTIKTTAGDYNERELDLAVNTPARNALIVRKYQELTPHKRAVAFCVTIAHAEALARAFNDAGVPAAVIEGSTSLDERAHIYAAFRAGEIKVLCNVMVLCEGWDEPLCEVAIMARPTQSRALFTQQFGRVLRLAPGKQYATILDITDNSYRLRLTPQNIGTVLGRSLRNHETLRSALVRQEQAEKPALVHQLTDKRNKDQVVDLFALPEWQERPDGKFVMEIGLEKHRIALVPVKQSSFTQLYEVWARLAPTFAGQRWASPQPLDSALQFAEKRARMLLSGNSKLVDKQARWRNDPISEAQKKALRWYRIPVYTGMTKGQAADLIDAHKLEQQKKA